VVKRQDRIGRCRALLVSNLCGCPGLSGHRPCAISSTQLPCSVCALDAATSGCGEVRRTSNEAQPGQSVSGKPLRPLCLPQTTTCRRQTVLVVCTACRREYKEEPVRPVRNPDPHSQRAARLLWYVSSSSHLNFVDRQLNHHDRSCSSTCSLTRFMSVPAFLSMAGASRSSSSSNTDLGGGSKRGATRPTASRPSKARGNKATTKATTTATTSACQKSHKTGMTPPSPYTLQDSASSLGQATDRKPIPRPSSQLLAAGVLPRSNKNSPK
jgi:hypothetical protein